MRNFVVFQGDLTSLTFARIRPKKLLKLQLHFLVHYNGIFTTVKLHFFVAFWKTSHLQPPENASNQIACFFEITQYVPNYEQKYASVQIWGASATRKTIPYKQSVCLKEDTTACKHGRRRFKCIQ